MLWCQTNHTNLRTTHIVTVPTVYTRSFGRLLAGEREREKEKSEESNRFALVKRRLAVKYGHLPHTYAIRYYIHTSEQKFNDASYYYNLPSRRLQYNVYTRIYHVLGVSGVKCSGLYATRSHWSKRSQKGTRNVYTQHNMYPSHVVCISTRIYNIIPLESPPRAEG